MAKFALSFPVIFHLGALNFPAHLVFESLAYFVGYRLYIVSRKTSFDAHDDKARLNLLIGAILGAGIGSKLLGFLEHRQLWELALKNPIYLMASKTILGGILGGYIGVEIAKKLAGIKTSTGDIYVFPLIIAMIIGRIGCFLTGVSDGTWGNETQFFVGFDAGDGVIRHPTPLYEIIALVMIAAALKAIKHNFTLKNGDLFKLFVIAYCAWRFGIEFLKPVDIWPLLHVSILQIAALMGVLITSILLIMAQRKKT